MFTGSRSPDKKMAKEGSWVGFSTIKSDGPLLSTSLNPNTSHSKKKEYLRMMIDDNDITLRMIG